MATVKKAVKKVAKKAKKVVKKASAKVKKAAKPLKKSVGAKKVNKASPKVEKKGFKQSAIAKPKVKAKTSTQALKEKEEKDGSKLKPDLKGNTNSSKRSVAKVKTVSQEGTKQEAERIKPRTSEKSQKQDKETERLLPDTAQDVQGSKNHGYAGAGMNIDSDEDDHREDLKGADLAQKQAIESTSSPVRDQDQ